MKNKLITCPTCGTEHASDENPAAFNAVVEHQAAPFTVTYKWLERGETKHASSVASGTDQADAERNFARENPHVTVLPQLRPSKPITELEPYAIATAGEQAADWAKELLAKFRHGGKNYKRLRAVQAAGEALSEKAELYSNAPKILRALIATWIIIEGSPEILHHIGHCTSKETGKTLHETVRDLISSTEGK